MFSVDVSVATASLAEMDVDLLIAPAYEGRVAVRLDELTSIGGDAVRAATLDFDGASDAAVLAYASSGKVRRLALVGLGPSVVSEQAGPASLRRAAAAGERLAAKYGVASVGLLLPPDGPEEASVAAQALVEGYMLSAYRFARYKTAPAKKEVPALERMVVHANGGDAEEALRGAERGRILAASVAAARDLVNISPDEKSATAFSSMVADLGREHGFSVDVWDKARIAEEGMGGLLAVNRGSQEPPTFSILTWKPDRAPDEPPMVLVGKGVMFDTGGLSLKPTANSMDHMKADMAGAAAVVGAMTALARLDFPRHVVALIPATDNRPGEDAYVPGDVVRMHSGKTVEVLNTDAEGRMILADALSWASAYDPSLVIELSTLTGAQVVALGSEVAAVMTNDRPGSEIRLQTMEEAGRRTGDLVHRMPMYPHYGALMRSEVADLQNISSRREAGSITAAKFLEHFVNYPWIHIDLAGPSFLKHALPWRPKGGTGFGVRLLVDFLHAYPSA